LIQILLLEICSYLSESCNFLPPTFVTYATVYNGLIAVSLSVTRQKIQTV